MNLSCAYPNAQHYDSPLAANQGLPSTRGVAQPGRALALGARSRQFESGRPDHSNRMVQSLKLLAHQMSALYAATLQTFKAQGWHYREVAGIEVLEADFEAHHTKVALHVQIYGEAHIATVVATASLQVAHTHRLQVSELLMRTNKELNLGNFELDWDSGAVMFRITNIFPPHRYDERILATLVHSTIAETDRLTPFLGEICNTPKGELILLRVRDLMKREDLLPPAPAEEP